MKKMTHATRAELANAVRDRYVAAAGKFKRGILDEFIAATGYHEKSAIRVLNSPPASKRLRTRQRPSLYDEAVRGALIVLWEASDRVCGKRLKALLPILLPALERNGHLKLDEQIRPKILSMSGVTIDRLLRMPKSAMGAKKAPRVVPEPRRRIKMRTFADWNDPPPGSMERDLVAHCGAVNRGSYVHSLVLTDIASGWTEAAPIVVREGTLVVETLDRINGSLPFALQALDVDNGSEFVNDKLIQYCLNQRIELTRSRPYRKNDQAWIEQKNGAIARKPFGLSTLRGLGGCPCDHPSVRSLQAVRQRLPAVVQTGGQAARRRQGNQALSSIPNAVRATPAVGQYPDAGKEQAAGDRGGTRSFEASGGDASGPGLFGGAVGWRHAAADEL